MPLIIDPSTGKSAEGSIQPSRSWLELLPNLRDAALVTATATYTSGYIIWGLYAYDNGLGTRPAGQIQYVVAGLPAVIIFIFLAILFYSFPTWLKRLRDTLVRRFGRRGDILLSLLGLATMVLSRKVDDRLASEVRVGPLFIGAVLVILQVLALGVVADRFPVRLFLLPLIPLSLLYLYGYALLLYPRLPQELGGGRPRCVMIGISEAAVTPAWRKLVIDARLAAEATMGRPKNTSSTVNRLLAMRKRDTIRLMGGEADVAEFTTAGPLMLWTETDSQLFLSIGAFGADLDDRFVIARTPSTMVRFVSEIGASGAGCPTVAP